MEALSRRCDGGLESGRLVAEARCGQGTDRPGYEHGLRADPAFEDFAKVKSIAKSLICRARLETVDNDPSSGATYAAPVKLGVALETGNGTLFAYLVGISLTDLGDRAIQKDAPSIQTKSLEEILRLLPEPASIARGLPFTQRGELDYGLRYIRYLSIKTPNGQKGDDPTAEALAKNPHAFDVLETVKLMANQSRHFAAIEAKPYWQAIGEGAKAVNGIDEDVLDALAGLPMLDTGTESTSGPDGTKPKALTDKQQAALQETPNIVGKYLSSAFGLPIPEMIKASAKSQADLSATRLIVALQLYKRTYGGFPATLQALVDKGTLRALPEDPFDGKPFRYDAKRAIIWSVWFDMKDQGGHTAPHMRKKKPPAGSPDRSADVDDVVWPIDGHTEAR